MEITCDNFLDGRLHILQPKIGYRAAIDPVLLAASIKAIKGSSILDIGCGVGVASLCLGRRISGVELTGLELQTEYVDLALENAKNNGLQFKVIKGDLCDIPAELKSKNFDHVITNPPFHIGNTTHATNANKALSDHETMALEDWISACLKRVKPRGYFTLIHRAERLPKILTALKKCGEICILPIAPRQDKNAHRVLVRARINSKAVAKLCPPFIMHKGERHMIDGDDFTQNAKVILRDAMPLNWP